MFKLKWIFVLVFLFIAVQPAFADDRAEKIKEVLLKPSGWIAYGNDCTSARLSWQAEFTYEARGEKTIVKILRPGRSGCEREVTITSVGIKHAGCGEPHITLSFDPNDKDYPFKGWSAHCSEYKLKAK
jgi:hypothetical protein